MTNFVYNSVQTQPRTSLPVANIVKSVKTVTATVAKILDANPNRVKVLIDNPGTTDLLFAFDSAATPVPSDTVCLKLPGNDSKFIEEGAYSGAALNLFAGGFAGDIIVWEWVLD